MRLTHASTLAAYRGTAGSLRPLLPEILLELDHIAVLTHFVGISLAKMRSGCAAKIFRVRVWQGRAARLRYRTQMAGSLPTAYLGRYLLRLPELLRHDRDAAKHTLSRPAEFSRQSVLEDIHSFCIARRPAVNANQRADLVVRSTIEDIHSFCIAKQSAVNANQRADLVGRLDSSSSFGVDERQAGALREESALLARDATLDELQKTRDGGEVLQLGTRYVNARRLAA